MPGIWFITNGQLYTLSARPPTALFQRTVTMSNPTTSLGTRGVPTPDIPTQPTNPILTIYESPAPHMGLFELLGIRTVQHTITTAEGAEGRVRQAGVLSLLLLERLQHGAVRIPARSWVGNRRRQRCKGGVHEPRFDAMVRLLYGDESMRLGVVEFIYHISPLLHTLVGVMLRAGYPLHRQVRPRVHFGADPGDPVVGLAPPPLQVGLVEEDEPIVGIDEFLEQLRSGAKGRRDGAGRAGGKTPVGTPVPRPAYRPAGRL
jgi:hypothetical protein